MSEASSRQEMEQRLIQRSLEDESFRRRLLEDPKVIRGGGIMLVGGSSTRSG